MRILLSLIITCISFIAFADTHEYTLNNGLKVIVKEDHRAPVAVAMVWYKVGSSDEQGGKTGISHALEHMMFKGTKNYPAGIFSKIIASLGGQENAFTNHDYTAYFEKISTEHLAKSFELEADRMQNLILSEKEFTPERSVIQEERRLRTDDNPKALTVERFLATAHLASSYHHPVIGWMSDIQQLNIQDLQTWYNKYYSPNNATLVVVGDVNAANVLALARQYFEKIPASSPIEKKAKIEPEALGKKYVEVKRPAEIPMILLGFTVPSVNSSTNLADPYTLEIIAGILDAGESARFSKELIRKQELVSDALASYNLYAKYQTQFMIYATPNTKHNLDEVKDGLLLQIERLKNELVNEEELQRVKTQIIAQKTFEKDSIFSQAMELGLTETVGLGWQVAELYVDRINKVTAEQIQQAAIFYFNKNNLTEARLIPEKNLESTLPMNHMKQSQHFN